MNDNFAERFARVEDARYRAMIAADTGTLGSLLDDALSYVHTSGVVESKPEFLAKIASGVRRYRRLEVVERAFRRRGSVVIGMGSLDVETDVGAETRKLRIVYTAVYSADGDRRLLAYHGTRLGP